MRLLATTLFSFCLIACGTAAAQQAATEGAKAMPKSEEVRALRPCLRIMRRRLLWAICGSGPVFRLETAAS